MIGRSPGLEWRYSFSQAEIIMCKKLPKAAKTAFVGFKAMIKKYVNMRHCSSRDSEVKIKSYAMKCILLRYVEAKYDEVFWDDEANNDTLVASIYK